ncbi:MAG: Holliday junction branch migration protein RuvA [Candidatus Paceibacterota bacterium]
MIRSIKGEITTINENSIVVEVYGIGYQIYTNIQKHQLTPTDQVLLHTHQVVRENVLDLYGFIDETELQYFELLLTIPKLGPKSALQILNQADVILLNQSIIEQDPDHLHKLSGIGKKTATNIVSSLSGKIEPLFNSGESNLQPPSILSSTQIDAIDALITLGYDPKEARAYITKMTGEDDTKTMIQNALKQIPIP